MSTRARRPANTRAPLTDGEISERYGDLIAAALDAFGADVSYIIEMIESANRLRESSRMYASRGRRRREERNWTTTPWAQAIDEALRERP